MVPRDNISVVASDGRSVQPCLFGRAHAQSAASEYCKDGERRLVCGCGGGGGGGFGLAAVVVQGLHHWSCEIVGGIAWLGPFGRAPVPQIDLLLLRNYPPR